MHSVTSDEALRQARHVPTHALMLTKHAEIQMCARRVQASDICRALATAKAAVAQETPRKWRFEGGTDIEGDGLIVVASFEGNGVVIVSVFQ